MSRRILILRPEPAASRNARQLAEHGHVAVAAPPLKLTLPTDRESAAQQVRDALARAHWLVFPSARALGFTLELARDIDPPRVRVAVPGPATADAVRAAGFVDVTVPGEPHTSEALLALPALQDVAGRTVAVFSAPGGRRVIAETLAGRGARVETVTVYRCEPLPPPSPDPTGDAALLSVIGSGAALDAMLEHWPEGLRRRIHQGEIWLPSERLAMRARKAGARAVRVIPPSRLDDLPALLEDATP